MQKLEGDGMAFVHAGGHVMHRDLQFNEVLKIDTGCIVAFTPTVHYDIQFVGGIKNTIFGGEGLFFATLRGPGRVWIQSLPISRLASKIISYGGTTGRREEGSIDVYKRQPIYSTMQRLIRAIAGDHLSMNQAVSWVSIHL